MYEKNSRIHFDNNSFSHNVPGNWRVNEGVKETNELPHHHSSPPYWRCLAGQASICMWRVAANVSNKQRQPTWGGTLGCRLDTGLQEPFPVKDDVLCNITYITEILQAIVYWK